MKKHNSKLILSTLIILLLLFSAVACGGELPQHKGDAEVEETIEDHNTESGLRIITDMAGRQVEIPQNIKKVFSTGASGTVFLYTACPDLLLGVNYEFNASEKEYILDDYKELPAYGQGDKINKEVLIGVAPDVCISFGTITEREISSADEFQKQTGLPVVIIDGELRKSEEAYSFLGELIGREAEMNRLAAYAKEALDFATAFDIKEINRVSVYFGNGHESLETAPKGSPHAEVLDLVKGANVAVLEDIESNAARIDISAEQILTWNPEVIIINGEPSKDLSPKAATDKFAADKRYRNLRAVKNEKVFPIPKYPFAWFDRPPGPNRLVGIYWLAALLYPEQEAVKAVNVQTKVEEFYKLFYHLEVDGSRLIYPES